MDRWISADLHFYHKNIIKYCNRPEDHLEQLVQQHASMIKREDVWYCLGDVCFGSEQQLREILAQIRGRKYLIRGNHDHWSDTKYMLCGFDGVFDALVVQNALLTHEPSFIFGNWMCNIHGHLHNIVNKEQEQAFGGNYGVFNDGKHVLYSPENEGYKPVKLEQLAARCKPDPETLAIQEVQKKIDSAGATYPIIVSGHAYTGIATKTRR